MMSEWITRLDTATLAQMADMLASARQIQQAQERLGTEKFSDLPGVGELFLLPAQIAITGFVSDLQGDPALPKRGEQAVVALSRPKTAALCFDRVWGLEGMDIPPEIRFSTGSQQEYLFAFVAFHVWLKVARPNVWKNLEYLLSLRHGQPLDLDGLFEVVAQSLDDFNAVGGPWLGRQVALQTLEHEGFAAYFGRYLAQGASRQGIPTVPYLGSSIEYDRQYAKGDRTVIVAAIEGLPVVSEEDLSWEQVIEFRRDSESQRNFQRLIHWLDGEMVDKDWMWVADDLIERLEAYEVALGRHGIVTLTGVLKSLNDPKKVLAAIGIFAALPEDWAPLAAGLSLGAGVLASVAETWIDRREFEEESQAIAFLTELRRAADSGNAR